MNLSENSVAFGGPGIEPRWTSSAKEGVCTAHHASCRVWFTLSHGSINEIYHLVWTRDLVQSAAALLATGYEAELDLRFIDVPAAEWPVGWVLSFTCFWKSEQR